jgi:hypothetical protein
LVTVKKHNDNANFYSTVGGAAIAWKTLKSKRLILAMRCAYQHAKNGMLAGRMNSAGEFCLRQMPIRVVNPLV